MFESGMMLFPWPLCISRWFSRVSTSVIGLFKSLWTGVKSRALTLIGLGKHQALNDDLVSCFFVHETC